MADAAKPPKQRTRAQLELDADAARVRVKEIQEAFDAQRRELTAATDREKATRAQFDDLKARLVEAEAANQYLRGYVARVHGDDTVREELVTVGDPAGEQQLVPKRRPPTFLAPDSYGSPGMGDTDRATTYLRDRDRPKPRHYVTY